MSVPAPSRRLPDCAPKIFRGKSRPSLKPGARDRLPGSRTGPQDKRPRVEAPAGKALGNLRAKEAVKELAVRWLDQEGGGAPFYSLQALGSRGHAPAPLPPLRDGPVDLYVR